MLRCLAIDDEPLALRQLAVYIEKVDFLELVGECRSAAEALRVMEREAVDALFIDINMPDLSGLDFVRSLAAPPLVVFTTAYSNYAVDGFKVEAVDYLLKPFGLDDFRSAALRVKARYDLMHTPRALSPIDEDDALFFKTDYKVVRIPTASIRYVEGMSEYLRIYVSDRDKPVTVLLAMKKLEERLPSTQFMRIHRSYIINLRSIVEVGKSRVLIAPDTQLPVGDAYREGLNAYIESKFLGK